MLIQFVFDSMPSQVIGDLLAAGGSLSSMRRDFTNPVSYV
jgi:hypothetical protein